MSNQQPDKGSPDRAAEGRSARYGKPDGAKGSGHQESRKPEKKEERGFVSRQGGSQNRDDGGGREDSQRGDGRRSDGAPAGDGGGNGGGDGRG